MKIARLLALFALIALTTPGPAAAETRALIVGVSNYQHLDPSKYLWAPKNDVKEIEELLRKRGVKKSNMTLIADGISPQNPTRQNLMDALRTLTERSKRGDFAIVYFSGHGSYQPNQGDPRHDKEDGYNEVFLPYDVEPTPLEANSKEIKNAIIDYQLGEFADAIRDKGVDLWFILDSCYSGTGLRASGQFHDKLIEPRDLGVKVEKTPDPKKPIISISGKSVASRSSAARGRYVFFSASRANEPSREIPVPGSVPVKDATWRSAFTHTMVMVMTKAPKRTYSQFIKEINDIMGEPGSRITQTATIEGDMQDHFAFGHDLPASGTAQWPLVRERLDAGIANGVEKGAILALYDKPDAKDADAIGYGRVIEADATEAKISPLREYPCPVVDGNIQCRTGGAEITSRARYARLFESPLDFAFSVSAPRASLRAPEALRARAKEVFGALRGAGTEAKALRGRVHFADENPDFVWQVTPEGFRIAPDGSDLSKLDVGAAVDLTGAEPLEEIKAKTTRILLRAYRVERLRRQAVKDAEGVSEKPRLRVAFDALPRAYDDKLDKCVAVPEMAMKPVEGAFVAEPCMHVRINVTNAGPASRFVSLFLIDHDWNFIDLCKEAGTDTTLAPGARRSCLLPYGKPLPGGSDFARYSLAILSTAERRGVAARNFDDIKNLNNAEGAASRGGSDPFGIDDELAGIAEGRRSADKNAATVTWVEWDLDHRAR